ncbi:MAG: hypothetical protein ABIV26_01020, partial [Candidatus Limnocylindrales bacterium]
RRERRAVGREPARRHPVDSPGATPPWTDDPAFESLESAYRALLEAWGEWMVVHHRGAPLYPGGPHEAAVAAALVDARRSLGVALEGIDRATVATADGAALDNIRSSLPELDAWASPLDGIAPHGAPEAASEEPDVAALRRATFDAWGAAMAGLPVAGELLDRLTVSARLAREPDAERRRALFLALRPGWEALHGDGGPSSPYRRLVRSSAARWAREGSPIDANAAALGMDPATVEQTMRRLLAAYRAVALGDELVEPWDYRFVTGGLARRLDDALPVDRLRLVNDAHLRSIGADPDALRIRYNIVPRPGRPVIPTAFTVTEDVGRLERGTWVPATPWIFATYAEGGLGNLEELLHESGHALHYAALRSRPAHFAWPADQAAFVEAVADVVGWTTHEPAFLRDQLGAAVSVRESVVARFGAVALDAAWTLFEIELHRRPSRSPNEAWAEISERDLGVVGHPEWAWWAHRGQLIDGPGYLSSYALGAVMVAAVRARIRAMRGDWSTGDLGWYAFVSERLLRFAGARTPASILGEFLEGPLTAGPLLAAIEAGA